MTMFLLQMWLPFRTLSFSRENVQPVLIARRRLNFTPPLPNAETKNWRKNFPASHHLAFRGSFSCLRAHHGKRLSLTFSGIRVTYWTTLP